MKFNNTKFKTIFYLLLFFMMFTVISCTFYMVFSDKISICNCYRRKKIAIQMTINMIIISAPFSSLFKKNVLAF